MYLDALGHTFADLHVVLAAHVLLDIGRKVIARDADGVVRHNTSQRDDGDFGRATSYVHNHVAFRRFYVDADTDSGGHGFEDEVNVTSTSMLGRVAHGTELHFGTA